jgi:hypothetical protein
MHRTLVILRGSRGRSLTADQSLTDLIMKLKADCSKILEYLHISKYDLLVNTSCMCLAVFTLLTLIRRLPDT